MSSFASPSQATKASRRGESTKRPCGWSQSTGTRRTTTVRARVDHRDLVAGLHVDEDATGAGVVLDVARLAAELDGRDPLAAGIDDGLDTTALVGDEHVPLDRVVGETVRIAARRGAREHLAGAGVDRTGLVVVGGRGEDATELRHRDHAMDAGGGEPADHAPALQVEDEQLVRVHVRDVEPLAGGSMLV